MSPEKGRGKYPAPPFTPGKIPRAVLVSGAGWWLAFSHHREGATSSDRTGTEHPPNHPPPGTPPGVVFGSPVPFRSPRHPFGRGGMFPGTPPPLRVVVPVRGATTPGGSRLGVFHNMPRPVTLFTFSGTRCKGATPAPGAFVRFRTDTHHHRGTFARVAPFRAGGVSRCFPPGPAPFRVVLSSGWCIFRQGKHRTNCTTFRGTFPGVSCSGSPYHLSHPRHPIRGAVTLSGRGGVFDRVPLSEYPGSTSSRFFFGGVCLSATLPGIRPRSTDSGKGVYPFRSVPGYPGVMSRFPPGRYIGPIRPGTGSGRWRDCHPGAGTPGTDSPGVPGAPPPGTNNVHPGGATLPGSAHLLSMVFT